MTPAASAAAIPLTPRGKELRQLMLQTMYTAGRGHLPSAFSLTEILSVLYDTILKVDPANPCWPERDRLILSKGHGCLALYAVLADRGFFPREDLETFCAFDSHLGGHPERGRTPGVEASTGSLGHGPSLGVGMALAMRLQGLSSRVFVVCGDGETDEGSVWEAMLSASKHALDTFTLIIDHNKLQSWGSLDAILPLAPYKDKWRAFGAGVAEADGHDPEAVRRVLTQLPVEKGKPSVVIMHTVKGKGIPMLENNLSWHHKTRMTEQEYHLLADSLEGGR